MWLLMEGQQLLPKILMPMLGKWCFCLPPFIRTLLFSVNYSSPFSHCTGSHGLLRKIASYVAQPLSTYVIFAISLFSLLPTQAQIKGHLFHSTATTISIYTHIPMSTVLRYAYVYMSAFQESGKHYWCSIANSHTQLSSLRKRSTENNHGLSPSPLETFWFRHWLV